MQANQFEVYGMLQQQFNEDQNIRLQSIYHNRCQNYLGDQFLDKYKFDVEDIEAATAEMKRGKAAGLDELTIEHLAHSHPVLFAIQLSYSILCLLVTFITDLSYTVPLPKADSVRSTKAIDNYRAISISPIISKIFERCILQKYSKFLCSSPNQFGFKKG